MPARRKPAAAIPKVRLARCDLSACEAVCCHDGAYLEFGDEVRIQAAIAEYPEHFTHVPSDYVEIANWRGLGEGRKTRTRPWTYTRSIPMHFTATRCVFGEPNGWCSLESAARAHGLHPWTFKPENCFLFPLHGEDPEDGPARPGADPHDYGPDYPGYSTIVDCGRHRPDGLPWREVLREELEIVRTPIDVYFRDWSESRRDASE
ncbi:hypothetical protein ASA1KI_17430 [Opitutales bacterium ASA1]|uniref:hypothetical protein n=1 Tax=Congregicoccus parvus TaxID=3081749 RepID=UPI002B323775|nr:hypothetical protein ASA1KI_17430 [Opitutales bacterium ASA1]